MIYEEILLYHFPEFRAEYESKIKKGQSVYNFILTNDNALKVYHVLNLIIFNIFFLLQPGEKDPEDEEDE